MTTDTQLAIALGMVAALGALLIIRELYPRRIDAVDVAARLTNVNAARDDYDSDSDEITDRLGRALLGRIGTWSILRIPHRDLALLRISVARFLGEKALCALLGLLLPTFSTVVLYVVGFSMPIAVPVLVSIGMAIVFSFFPNLGVADRARVARAEFARAMTSYIDLVSLERAGGSGPVQALEHAADVGDSWVFGRIRDELNRARWSGTPAWEALKVVGEELRVPHLVETADVMRLAADQGATVYENLRARASSMRAEILSSDKTSAGIRTERSTLPVAMTVVVFMAMLVTPMAISIAS